MLESFLFTSTTGCSPRNLNLETPLHIAITEDHIDAAKMLINANADFTARDFLERTPFELVKELHRDEIIVLFEKPRHPRNLVTDYKILIEIDSGKHSLFVDTSLLREYLERRFPLKHYPSSITGTQRFCIGVSLL